MHRSATRRRRRALPLIAGLAMLITVAFAGSAGAVSTAAPAHAATRAAVEPVTPAQTAVVVTTSTGPTTTAAGTGCATKTMTGNLVTAVTGWPILGTFYQTTHFCWNGKIVTSRSTTYTGTVTASGSLSGIQYVGTVAGSVGWNCYRASGSNRPCSGNAQYGEGQFGGCIAGHCTYSYINLQSSENYKGQWFWGYRG
jgi:hypothetical protein